MPIPLHRTHLHRALPTWLGTSASNFTRSSDKTALQERRNSSSGTQVYSVTIDAIALRTEQVDLVFVVEVAIACHTRSSSNGVTESCARIGLAHLPTWRCRKPWVRSKYSELGSPT